MEHKYKDEYKKLDLDSPKKKHSGVSCPNCDTPTLSPNLNIQDKIAKCDQCHSVFSFEAMLPELIAKPTEVIQRPQGVDVVQLDNELEFSMTQPYSQILGSVALILPLFLVLFLLLFFKDGKQEVIYPLVGSVVVLLYSLYKLYMTKFAKTYVSVDRTHINVMWRPNNLVKDRSFPIQNIDQIYIRATSKGVCLYLVNNTIDGQKHEELVGRFTDLTKAKYIEQELEKHLGIENRKVIYEYK